LAVGWDRVQAARKGGTGKQDKGAGWGCWKVREYPRGMKKRKGDDGSRRMTDVVPFGLKVVGGWLDGRKKLED
jgi:hypothetical protein